MDKILEKLLETKEEKADIDIKQYWQRLLRKSNKLSPYDMLVYAYLNTWPKPIWELIKEYKSWKKELLDAILGFVVIMFMRMFNNYFDRSTEAEILQWLLYSVRNRIIDMYDEKKWAVTTYFWYWIKSLTIKFYIESKYLIHVPVYIFSDKDKLNKKFFENLIGGHISLDMPVWEDNKWRLGDFMSDEYSRVDKNIENKYVKERLIELMKTCLTERERNILVHRYWIDGAEIYNLDKLGEIYWVSRERIRQIENTAIQKLRMNPEIQKLLWLEENYEEKILKGLLKWEIKPHQIKGNTDKMKIKELFRSLKAKNGKRGRPSKQRT